MNAAWHGPAIRGGLLALLAATLFGVSTPMVQRFGAGLGGRHGGGAAVCQRRRRRCVLAP